MAKLSKTTWTTYATSGYTHDVANDQRSAGGVHLHQVRKGKTGWQTRICQSNGRHEAYGPVTPISDEDGEAKWAQIVAEEERSANNRKRAKAMFPDSGW